MKSKRGIALFLVLFIFLGNTFFVLAGDAVDTKTIVPLVNLEGKTVTVKAFSQYEKKEKEMIENKLFNFLDFRVNENLQPQVWNPNKSDGSGAEISYNQLLPKYFWESGTSRMDVVDYKIDEKEITLNGDRSFGEESSDRKIKDGISESTGEATDTKPMILTYEPYLKNDNSVDSDAKTQSSLVTTFLNKGFDTVFNELLPNNATQEMFEDALEDFNALGNTGGEIVVDGVTYTLVFPTVDGEEYDKNDEQKAKREKKNYIYYRDNENMYYGYIYEGTMPIGQVELNRLKRFNFGIPKGYVKINGKAVLDKTKYINYYQDDTTYFTLKQMSMIASALYYGKNTYSGNINLIQERDFGGISGTIAGWADSLKVFADSTKEGIWTFEFADREAELSINGIANMFVFAFIGVFSVIIVPIIALKNAMSDGSVGVKLSVQSLVGKYLAFGLLSALSVGLKTGLIVFSAGATNFLTGYFSGSLNAMFAGGGIGVADKWIMAILSLGQLLVMLAGVVNYFVGQAIVFFVPIILLYQLFIKNDHADISILWDIAGRILTTPMLTLVFAVSGLVVSTANMVNIVLAMLYIVIAILLIKYLEQKLDISIFGAVGTAFKVGAATASAGALALGGASAMANGAGNMGRSKGKSESASSEPVSAGGESAEGGVSGAVSGSTGGENHNLRGQEQRNSSKIEQSIAQSGMGKVKTMAGDTVSKAGEGIKSAYQARGGGQGSVAKNVVAGVGMGFGTVGKGLQAGLRQTSNALDIGKHGLKAIESGLNGNATGVGNQVNNMVQNAGAIKNAGADTARSAKDYVGSAYAQGQAQRLQTASNGVLDRQVSGEGDNLFHTDTVDRDMFTQNGITDIETGKNGKFDISYSENNASEPVREQLDYIMQRYDNYGGVDEGLQNMGIIGVGVQNKYDSDNNVIDRKIKLTMNSNAREHMGVDTISQRPDGNIDLGYNVKKYGKQQNENRPYIPNAKDNASWWNNKNSKTQAN